MLYFIRPGDEAGMPLQALERGLSQAEMDTLIKCVPQMIGEPVMVLDYSYDAFTPTDSRAHVLALRTDGKVHVVEFRCGVADNTELKCIEYAANLAGAGLQDLAAIYAGGAMSGGKMAAEDAQNLVVKHLEGPHIDEDPRIVLLAREFRPELLSAVGWLGKQGVDINCVRFQAYDLGGTWLVDTQAGESGAQPSLPVATAEAGAKSAAAAATMEQEALDTGRSPLLEAVEAMLRESPLELQMTVCPDALVFATSQDTVSFDLRVRRHPESLVELSLSFTEDNIDANRTLANLVLSQRERIEQELGEVLQVKDPWYQSWVKVSLYRNYDVDDPGYAGEVVEAMTRFVHVLLPRLARAARVHKAGA